MNDADGYHKEYPDKKRQEKDEDQVASHPILLYKLIKQMNWFYQKVYLYKLHSVASNKGNFINLNSVVA